MEGGRGGEKQFRLVAFLWIENTHILSLSLSLLDTSSAHQTRRTLRVRTIKRAEPKNAALRNAAASAVPLWWPCWECASAGPRPCRRRRAVWCRSWQRCCGTRGRMAPGWIVKALPTPPRSTPSMLGTQPLVELLPLGSLRADSVASVGRVATTSD